MNGTEKPRTIKLRYGLEAVIITKPPPPLPGWAQTPPTSNVYESNER